MNNYDFYFLFYKNQLLFWLSLAICLCLFYFVYRRYIVNFLDPLLFSYIITSFGATDVLLMYLTHSIKTYYLVNYLLTQSAFFLGLWLFKPFNSIKNEYKIRTLTIPNEELVMKIFFIICSLLLILIQLQVYAVAGIPIISNSRLDTFSGGSGFGIFSRVIEVVQIFSITLLFYFFINIKAINLGFVMKIYCYMFAVLLVLFAILNGSKSGILLIIFSAFCAWVFSYNKDVNNSVLSFLSKYKLYILVFALLSAITVIMLQSDGDANMNPIEILAMRFVFSGDVYWYAYPNDVIIGFNNYNGFKALFTDLIGFLRLDSWDNLTGHFGIDLYKYHHSTQVTQGPNARHNVFGLLYFGFWGSYVFSFVLGIVFSFIRNILPILLPKNFLSMCILSYLFIKVVPAIDTDPILCITYIDNLLFITPFLLLLVFAIYMILLKKAD